MTLFVIVLEILAILANLAMPIVQSTALRMKAADITREMAKIRAAAESSYGQTHNWPEDQAPGTSPPELAPYLPPGFTFHHADYELDWDRWDLAEGKGYGTGAVFSGVTVVTRDPRLAALVARELREGETRLTLGNRTTLMIAEPASGEP